MTANNAQFVGRRKYVNQEDPSRNSTTIHFTYQDEFTEGTATVSFTIWGNDHSVDPNALVPKEHYNLYYYRNGKGYLQLAGIQKV